MSGLGLALSGGGFRATLYHLGVVRFLRDAGLLSQVTHVTSVSGGSILAAHLILNWDRYTGEVEAFDAAACEILDVVGLDIRNRIMRRFPFGTVYNGARRLVRRGPDRRATRTGLLEGYYEKALYGDTCLFSLPERPELHILATNLNDGCLCSFTREGLLLLRRDAEGNLSLEHQHVGLATVPMAVTASSAFPGFFPPLELSAREVGADEGEFQTQAFTDGGIYDNLGIRMFLALERSRKTPTSFLTRESFLDARAALDALNACSASSEATPIRRLAEIYAREVHGQSLLPGNGPLVDGPEALARGLNQIVARVDLREDPVLDALGHSAPDEIPSDRGRANQELLEATLRTACGGPALRLPEGLVDLVIASDAGKKFLAQRGSAPSGMITTAIRSSDILMDRVWQLETESFAERSGVVFTPITRVVLPEEDPTAPHPEIQRQATRMRTDLDRFTELERSALIRHGYCVARASVRPHLAQRGVSVPENAPWDPTDRGEARAAGGYRAEAGCPASVVVEGARALQESAQRHTFSRAFDPRDWVSFVYLPLLAVLLVGLPLLVVHLYQNARRSEMLTDAISEANPDFKRLLDLLREGQPSEWAPTNFDEVSQLTPAPGGEIFEVITDTRIVDLRSWTHGTEGRPALGGRYYSFRRIVVRKIRHEPTATDVYLPIINRMEELRCTSMDRRPVLRRVADRADLHEGYQRWEVDLNLSDLAVGGMVSIEIDGFIDREPHQSRRDTFRLNVAGTSDLAAMWILLPKGRAYQEFDIVSFEPESRGEVDIIEPTYQVSIRDGEIIHWSVIDPDEGRTYEWRLTWE